VVKARAFLPGYEPTTVATASLTNILNTLAYFVREDAPTQGDWFKAHGQEGALFEPDSTPPPFSEIVVSNAQYFIWTPSTEDPRALAQTAESTNRLAACWYEIDDLFFDVNIYSEAFHSLAVYLLDWDHSGRIAEVILSSADGQIFDQRRIENFDDGKYLVWNARGNLRLRIRRLAGNNAVISGIFLGPANPISADPSQLFTTFTETGDYQIRLSAPAGQSLELQYTTNLETWLTLDRRFMISTSADWTLPVSPETGFKFYRAVPSPAP
jgi:hypothetical protein